MLEIGVDRRLWSQVSLVLVLLVTFLPSGTGASNDLLPMVSSFQGLAETESRLSRYQIEASYDPANQTIDGLETITYRNTTGEVLNDIVLRLYPNADYYGDGGLTTGLVTVDGAQVPTVLDPQSINLRFTLLAPLPINATARIELPFTTTIPVDSGGSFGILTYDSIRGSTVLSDWYPIIAGREADRGWVTDLPVDNGDPTFSDAAFYDVELIIPANLTAFTSGSPVEERVSQNQREISFSTGPSREFVLVLDSGFDTARGTIGETEVSVVLTNDRGQLGSAAAAKVLSLAISALSTLNDRYGVYPYRQLEVVEADLHGALGVSWSGVIYLDGALIDTALSSSGDNGENEPDLTGALAFTIDHEVGHQWWGGIVGTNSNEDAFMVEGLTQYLATVVVGDLEGPEAESQVLETRVASLYYNLLAESGDQVADQSYDSPLASKDRIRLIYGKSALGFLAIREKIGDQAFFQALADYAETYDFAVATPEDLLGQFETSSGQQLDDLWSFWFYQADGTRQDVDALLAASS